MSIAPYCALQGWYDPRTAEIRLSGRLEVLQDRIRPNSGRDLTSGYTLTPEDLLYYHECSHWFLDLTNSFSFLTRVFESLPTHWIQQFCHDLLPKYGHITFPLCDL